MGKFQQYGSSNTSLGCSWAPGVSLGSDHNIPIYKGDIKI